MTYVTRPRRAEAVQYDGTNAAEIIAFAGEENTCQIPGGLEVRGSGGIWRNFNPGDWVIKDLRDGWIHPASPETFGRVWEQEP